MLISLIALVAVLVSSGLQLFSRGESAGDANNPLFRPQDPTTLTLALIGGATIAMYLTARRRARRRAAVLPKTDVIAAQSSPLAGEAAELVAGADTEQQSRGAA